MDPVLGCLERLETEVATLKDNARRLEVEIEVLRYRNTLQQHDFHTDSRRNGRRLYACLVTCPACKKSIEWCSNDADGTMSWTDYGAWAEEARRRRDAWLDEHARTCEKRWPKEAP